MNDVTAYEQELIDRTGWDIKEVRRVLEQLFENDTLSPSERQYYLEKISPF